MIDLIFQFVLKQIKNLILTDYFVKRLCILPRWFIIAVDVTLCAKYLCRQVLPFSIDFLEYFLIFVTGDFRAFDYGTSENLRKYNRTTPPPYNISRITTPVALFYGREDPFVSLEVKDTLFLIRKITESFFDFQDIRYLRKTLTNNPVTEEVPNKKFTHFDFLWAKDLKKLLNDRLVRLISNYNKNLDCLKFKKFYPKKRKNFSIRDQSNFTYTKVNFFNRRHVSQDKNFSWKNIFLNLLFSIKQKSILVVKKTNWI